MATKEKYDKMSSSARSKEDWMNKKWRPMMAWMYLVVCVFDFVAAPILWSIIQFWEVMPQNDAFRQWNPLTLQGAGLFHMAMGVVLGLTTWGRTQEKINGVVPSTLHPSGTTVTTTYGNHRSYDDEPAIVAVPVARPGIKPPVVAPVRKPTLGPDD